MVIKLFSGNYARDLFLSTGATTLAHRSGTLIMAVDARIMEAPERLGHGDDGGGRGDGALERSAWRCVSPKALERSAWRCVSPKALEVPRGTGLWQMRWWRRSWVIWFSILNELLFE